MTDERAGVCTCEHSHRSASCPIHGEELLADVRAGETTAESVLAAWFIDQYHLDFLCGVLNAGGTSVPEWAPHAGQRAQAQADAEKIVKALAQNGYVISDVAASDESSTSGPENTIES